MTKFGPVHSLVKKGHEVCGDQIIVYEDERKLVLAVFDGVSGEQGARDAATNAAKALLESLKIHNVVTDNIIRQAISDANNSIKKGYTTLAVAVIEKTGRLTLASVGDSAIYSMRDGQVSLELPLARAVKNEDSVLKFLSYRNIVTSVLGKTGSEIEINFADGLLRKGDLLIIASDGLVDNLYIQTKEGFVTDASGKEDLGELIKSDDPKEIVECLEREISDRLKKGKIEKPGLVLDPKKDDLSIIVFRWDYG